MKAMSGTTPIYAGLSSTLHATTVVDGFSIETESYQRPPNGAPDFEVTLH